MNHPVRQLGEAHKIAASAYYSRSWGECILRRARCSAVAARWVTVVWRRLALEEFSNCSATKASPPSSARTLSRSWVLKTCRTIDSAMSMRLTGGGRVDSEVRGSRMTGEVSSAPPCPYSGSADGAGPMAASTGGSPTVARACSGPGPVAVRRAQVGAHRDGDAQLALKRRPLPPTLAVDRTGEPVDAICRRLAGNHGIELSAQTSRVRRRAGRAHWR